ncbi:MAG: nucleoside triphosphate pyrophosphohydrolase [Anaerolineae bacterium]|nr:nucleoside triphosphate pyrophosphohydrolase [Anaerolineae bacterium]
MYEAIADQIVALGRRAEGVVYAVPGHPLVGELSVQGILSRARDEGLRTNLVEGLSFVEPVLSVLGIDGLGGLQLSDATELAAAHHPHLDPDRPALIGQLYGQRLASGVKLTLMNAYPEDWDVTLVRAAGVEGGTALTLPLYELDRGDLCDHLTTLYVPALPQGAGLPALQDTVARLRAPDGCPWDREQTHQSLRANLLEEAYEVLASLDAEDEGKLCEELGDLLMQIAMHVQIATEEGAFQFSDVIGGIDAKLKRRHPHVFGDLAVESTADVLRTWEAIKAAERTRSQHAGDEHSRLEGVPGILPSLARAQALGDRAARGGFDWRDLPGVLDKVGEELAELSESTDREARARELGDLLFSLVNVSRWLQVDAESALRGACDRFVQRYTWMEQHARRQGLDLSSLPLEEQDALWDQAKSLG